MTKCLKRLGNDIWRICHVDSNSAQTFLEYYEYVKNLFKEIYVYDLVGWTKLDDSKQTKFYLKSRYLSNDDFYNESNLIKLKQKQISLTNIYMLINQVMTQHGLKIVRANDFKKLASRYRINQIYANYNLTAFDDAMFYNDDVIISDLGLNNVFVHKDLKSIKLIDLEAYFYTRKPLEEDQKNFPIFE